MRLKSSLCSTLFIGICHAASLTSSSQATCFSQPAVNNSSSSTPTASSAANCAEMFSFSNSVASAAGTASYGSLSVTGSAGDKDLQTNYQSSVSFSDTLHLYGTNAGSSSGDVLVQFAVLVTGNLVPDGPLPFPTKSFSASFTGGAPPVSVSMACTFTCSPFSQTYLVKEDDAGGGPVSFSASLMGSGSTSAGDAAGSATLQLESISLLDPSTMQPLSGFHYSTDSGARYSIDAGFVPEPGSYALVLLGMAALGLARRSVTVGA